MISICIPAYEMHGSGVAHLTSLIDSIKGQTYKNYEIIVSDHSKNNDIEYYCKNQPIIYIRNNNKHGYSSANVNRSIKESNGEIIKPMFQDDYFFDTNALLKISKTQNSWGAVGFNHIDKNGKVHRSVIPSYNKDILKGVNTIGAPSTVFFRKKEFFDENLKWLMDCEFYHRLYQKFGEPQVIKDILVTIRLGDHTVSSNMDQKTKDCEGLYVLEKHNV